MKKILSLLGSLGMTAVASSALVSCSDVDRKAPDMGQIVKFDVKDPDKNGVINCYLLMRYEVSKSLSVDEVKQGVKLLDSEKKPVTLDNFKVELSEDFYKDNLGKKGDNSFTRVEVVVTWTRQAKKNVQNQKLFVTYRYATSKDYIGLKELDITYRADKNAKE